MDGSFQEGQDVCQPAASASSSSEGCPVKEGNLIQKAAAEGAEGATGGAAAAKAACQRAETEGTATKAAYKRAEEAALEGIASGAATAKGAC